MPPSSIDVLRTFSADCSISIRPTSVEPVKLSLRRRGSVMIGFETSLEEVLVRMLSTPAGRPHSSSSFASASIESGVFWAGFMTIVQPAAIAGPILRVPIAVGKFQGVIR